MRVTIDALSTELDAGTCRTGSASVFKLFAFTLLIAALLNGCAATGHRGDEWITSQEQHLAQLRENNAGRFYFERNVQGEVDYLGGDDVAPDCKLQEGAGATDEFVGCLLASLRPLYRFDLPAIRSSVRVVAGSSAPDADGLRSLEIHSTVGGLDVEGSNLRVTVNEEGAATQIVGRLIDPARYARSESDSLSAYADPEAALREAARQLRTPLTLDRRYFDPNARAAVSVYSADAADHRYYLFNERDARIVGTYSELLTDHALVDKQVSVYDHPIDYPFVFGGGSPGFPSALKTDSLSVEEIDSDAPCKYRFDRGASHSNAEPQLGYRVDGKYRPSGKSRVELEAPCGSGAPFFVGALPGSSIFSAVDTLYWMDQLREFANHPIGEYNNRYDWGRLQREAVARQH